MSVHELRSVEEDAAFLANKVSKITTEWFQVLYGRIMTTIEAGMPDGSQCKAVKDLAGQAIWRTYNEMWDELSRKDSVTE